MAVPAKLSQAGRKAIEQAEVIIEVGQESTLWVSRSADAEKYWHDADAEQHNIYLDVNGKISDIWFDGNEWKRGVVFIKERLAE